MRNIMHVASGVSARRLVALTGVLLAGCGGETLQVGNDDGRVRDPAEPVDITAAYVRCEAPPGVAELSGSPQRQLDTTNTLLVGRWLACPSARSSPDVPTAIEFAEGGAFRLRSGGDGVYARDGAKETFTLSYSLRYEVVYLPLGGVQYHLNFERNPLCMTWVDGPLTVRFVRI